MAPVAIACRMRSVPVMIYLPDMTPGLAVRWLSRLAQRVAVSFPEVAGFFGQKAVVTGYPVRADLLKATEDRQTARQRLAHKLGLDLEDRLPLLLVFGGSQGARTINRAVWQAVAHPVARLPDSARHRHARLASLGTGRTGALG